MDDGQDGVVSGWRPLESRGWGQVAAIRKENRHGWVHLSLPAAGSVGVLRA